MARVKDSRLPLSRDTDDKKADAAEGDLERRSGETDN